MARSFGSGAGVTAMHIVLDVALEFQPPVVLHHQLYCLGLSEVACKGGVMALLKDFQSALPIWYIEKTLAVKEVILVLEVPGSSIGLRP
jgi:hypothetical protein